MSALDGDNDNNPGIVLKIRDEIGGCNSSKATASAVDPPPPTILFSINFPKSSVTVH